MDLSKRDAYTNTWSWSIAGHSQNLTLGCPQTLWEGASPLRVIPRPCCKSGLTEPPLQKKFVINGRHTDGESCDKLTMNN